MQKKLESEIWFEFSHARGAGGQHVNKAATRVAACFAVEKSGVFTPTQRSRIMHKLHTRISQDGVLRVTVEDSRSQSYNRSCAVIRIIDLLISALHTPKKRVKTVATRGSKVRRLESKKRRGELKKQRRKVQY